MKNLPAIIAAFVITGLLGVGMLVVGGNALLNQNRVPMQNSPTSAQSDPQTSNVSQQQPTVNQLQDRIAQYQAREKQYQSELNSASQQLNQANQTLQQYQSLLEELQARGVIRVQSDGTILIPRRGGFGDDSGFGGSGQASPNQPSQGQQGIFQ